MDYLQQKVLFKTIKEKMYIVHIMSHNQQKTNALINFSMPRT